MKTFSTFRTVTALIVAFCAASASAQVGFNIGTLAPAEKITITFDVTITNPFPAGVYSVTNQGTVSGGNFSTVKTDDPQTGPVGDATVTSVDIPPVITSASNATFTVGVNGVFTVTRTGNPTPDLFVSGTIPNNIGFNPGTGNLSGTPNIGTGGIYPLAFTATNFAGTNVKNFMLTVLESPALSCPPNITTNLPGPCASAIAFSAAVTHGYPTPVLAYNLGTNVITSPYVFAPGTNIVMVSATNGVPPDKTCSFTVTVLPGSQAPLLSIVQSGTNVILSWSNVFCCYQLQYTPQLLPTNSWTIYPGPVTDSGGNIYATNAILPTNTFFRLSY